MKQLGRLLKILHDWGGTSALACKQAPSKVGKKNSASEASGSAVTHQTALGLSRSPKTTLGYTWLSPKPNREPVCRLLQLR